MLHEHVYVYISIFIMWVYNTYSLAQSAGIVEYSDCISAEGYNFPNKSPEYDSKQSDGEVPISL